MALSLISVSVGGRLSLRYDAAAAPRFLYSEDDDAVWSKSHITPLPSSSTVISDIHEEDSSDSSDEK